MIEADGKVKKNDEEIENLKKEVDVKDKTKVLDDLTKILDDLRVKHTLKSQAQQEYDAINKVVEFIQQKKPN